VLPYDDSDESEGGFDDHDSDFENELDPEEEEELDLTEDILLFEDNEVDSESDDGSFVDIDEYLQELTLKEPGPPPPAKIPDISTKTRDLKSRGYFDNGTRIQALTLLQMKAPAWQILQKTGMTKSTLYRTWDKAIKRGWNPDAPDPNPVLLHHVIDAPKSGRPPLSQEICDEVLRVVTRNSTTRMYSCQAIADEVSKNLEKEDIISASTVYRVLKKNGYDSYKPTVKPGLTKTMKEIRYQWCLEHRDTD
jgi:hypothetical protein